MVNTSFHIFAVALDIVRCMFLAQDPACDLIVTGQQVRGTDPALCF